MKVTYLKYPPSRVGQKVCFKDTQEGEYFILAGSPKWRVWYIHDNQEYSYSMECEKTWYPWALTHYSSHSDSVDESLMIIWSEQQVLEAGVPLFEGCSSDRVGKL